MARNLSAFADDNDEYDLARMEQDQEDGDEEDAEPEYVQMFWDDRSDRNRS